MLYPTSTRDAANDVYVDSIDAGAPASVLELFTGSAPAATTDADTGTKLATFTLPDPCFGASSGGTATAAAISDTTGLAAGTVGYWRVKDGNGVVKIQENYATGTMTLNTATVSVGVTVAVSSWTHSVGAGSN